MFLTESAFKEQGLVQLMKRITLISISLAISSLGIVALFFLEPDVSPQHLRINGTITNVNVKDKVTFITFAPDDFLVVSFEDLNVSKGKYQLVGRLQQYRGRAEFVVEDAMKNQ